MLTGKPKPGVVGVGVCVCLRLCVCAALQQLMFNMFNNALDGGYSSDSVNPKKHALAPFISTPLISLLHFPSPISVQPFSPASSQCQ